MSLWANFARLLPNWGIRANNEVRFNRLEVYLVAAESASHFFMKEDFAGPARGLPLLLIAMASQPEAGGAAGVCAWAALRAKTRATRLDEISASGPDMVGFLRYEWSGAMCRPAR